DDPELGALVRVNLLLKSFDDRQPAPRRVLQDEGIEPKPMKDKFELFPREIVVPMYHEHLRLPRVRRQTRNAARGARFAANSTSAALLQGLHQLRRVGRLPLHQDGLPLAGWPPVADAAMRAPEDALVALLAPLALDPCIREDGDQIFPGSNE